MRLALICSSGGHLLELYYLKDFWKDYDRFWVTFPTSDAMSLLSSEKKHWAYYPTNKNIKNLIRNFFLAIKILRAERPDFLASTGAGVSVPFIYAAKILGIKTVYVESFARIRDISLSGKLVYPIVNHFIVRWPELAAKYKKAEFLET